MPRSALIAGSGPVGCLLALSLAHQGWEVSIWEARPDPRTTKETIRSVNLAISARGLSALRAVEPDLVEEFLEKALPMEGRMIWDFNNGSSPQLYDPLHTSSINSISRSVLSSALLTRAEAHPNITVHFSRKIARIDWTRRKAFVEGPTGGWEDSQEGEGAEGWSLCVGADGCWSKVRASMLSAQPATFEQKQIPHVWIELALPAKVNAQGEEDFAISEKHLHIWPRQEFMLIGLPNKDKSFTMTLYAPSTAIDALSTPELARDFFRRSFRPSAQNPVSIVELMGEDQVVNDFMTGRRGGLTNISVDPIAYPQAGGVLVGDAAHSMVPFYGQGLNCGLEDVRILQHLLSQHGVTGTEGSDEDLKSVLGEYAKERKEDLKAIQELAMNNYDEMKSHVLSPMHLLRRRLDVLLSTLFPPPTAPEITSSLISSSLTSPYPGGVVSRWSTLYHMVTFRADVRYSEAWRREEYQKRMLNRIVRAVGALGGGAIVALLFALRAWRRGKR